MTAANVTPWHEREPQAFRDLERRVAVVFPDLRFLVRNGRLLLTGEFHLSHAGRVVDRYEIEVVVHAGGPTAGMPTVQETGGRIPRIADRHVNPDGTACITVPDEFWYRYPNGLDLVEFLRGPVLNYFVGQSLVERGEAWPDDERAHGADGVIEFYAALLGVSSAERVHAFLEMAAAKKVRSHWRCPCGSHRRVTTCHGDAILELRKRLSRSLLRASAAEIAAHVRDRNPPTS